jgi:ribose transport system substrate-binding protein
MHHPIRLAAGAVALVLISGSAAVAQSPAAEPEAWTQSDVLAGFDPLAVDLTGFTPGPNGEQSVNMADVADPTQECLDQVKGLKLAFLNGYAGLTWMSAIEAGVNGQAAEYGIDVVATATSNFDPAQEATAVETLMASQPDILITIPVDATAGAANYAPALEAGTTMAFYDNPVEGWTGGDQYAAIVTGDHYRMGKDAADLLAQAIGETGTYGFIQLDVPFYNSNNREKGFLAEMAQAHPGLKNVAWAGFTTDTQAAEAADAMLLQHPDLDGIYVSYSGGPGTAVLASLAAANNTHTKVVTHDLDAVNDVAMATKGSNYIGTAIEHTYDEGAGTVKAAVLARCGLDVPPFIVVPALAVNRDNLAQAWQEAFHMDAPADVQAALAE